MEYEPAKDAFKYAFAPTEIKDRWDDMESYVYVISKRVILDEKDPEAQPVQVFKVGTSTLSGSIQRLISMRTFLVSMMVHRLYLFERFQLPGQKKGADSSTYAYKAEQQLHDAIEAKFAPEKVRVSFPGSTAGFDSKSEWFLVKKGKEKPFLNFLDQTVFKSVGVPPLYGSAFTAKRRTRINIKPNARGVGFERVGTTEPKKKKTFRRSESVLARSDRAHRAAAVMALRAREQKKKDKEDRTKLKKTKPFWSKVFIGQTFRDPELGDGLLQFTELRQLRSLADFAAVAQLVVLYEKAGRKTRSSASSNNESEGYLTINEALDALGDEAVKKHKSSHDFYRRLNGFDDQIDYEAEALKVVTGRGAEPDWLPDGAWDYVLI